MKEIPLTRGLVALVDDEDFERVAALKWYAQHDIRSGRFYAARKSGPRGVCQRMHRFILGITDPTLKVDHKNGDGLDNQRDNIRSCSHTDNLRNSGKNCKSTSRSQGVRRNVRGKGWEAKIGIGGKQVYLGYFQTEEAAAEAYNRAAVEHYGKFARLNVVESSNSIMA